MADDRPQHDDATQRSGVSRRRLLGLLGAGAVGLGAGAAGVAAAEAATSPEPQSSGHRDVVPFHGPHQAGIDTDVQGNLHFAAFDVTAPDRHGLADLLARWTTAAAAMCAGQPIGADGADGADGALHGSPLTPPEDTGEALGLPASRLTLTIGFGPSLFDDRFGLRPRRPEALVDLPMFPGDALEPARCGGDIAIQACSDDPQVAVHAVRNLTRMAAGSAAIRWAQLGFGRAATTSKNDATPRNLFGFKDGTANITSEETTALDEQVWASSADGAAWMDGGSYLVARRIRMTVETWDRASLDEQEKIVGRTKGEGAPLGAQHEHDEIDLSKLPTTSHVALAHPSQHGGARLLRRGYNFVDGSDGLGHLDAGLFFLAYQRDPRRAFIPIQQALARHDAMSEYLRHTGSGIWACPPGVAAGGSWGDALLG